MRGSDGRSMRARSKVQGFSTLACVKSLKTLLHDVHVYSLARFADGRLGFRLVWAADFVDGSSLERELGKGAATRKNA